MRIAGAAALARSTLARIITEYRIPTPNDPSRISTGQDGALWFTEGTASSLGWYQL